jgi:Na+/H+ antiporter NhaC
MVRNTRLLQSKSYKLPEKAKGCVIAVLGLFFILVVFLLSDWVQSRVIDIVALLINTLILSNLFLFNILVIVILLGLLFLVLYAYSKL